MIIKYCEIYDLCFIDMLFIDILLLFLYKMDSYSFRVESTNRVYKTLTSLHKLSSLITNNHQFCKQISHSIETWDPSLINS